MIPCLHVVSTSAGLPPAAASVSRLAAPHTGQKPLPHLPEAALHHNVRASPGRAAVARSSQRATCAVRCTSARHNAAPRRLVLLRHRASAPRSTGLSHPMRHRLASCVAARCTSAWPPASPPSRVARATSARGTASRAAPFDVSVAG